MHMGHSTHKKVAFFMSKSAVSWLFLFQPNQPPKNNMQRWVTDSARTLPSLSSVSWACSPVVRVSWACNSTGWYSYARVLQRVHYFKVYLCTLEMEFAGMLFGDMEKLSQFGVEVGSHQWPFVLSGRSHFISLSLSVIICKIIIVLIFLSTFHATGTSLNNL